MSAKMRYYLLVYSRSHRRLETVQEFADQEEASRAYTATERAAQDDRDIEIVLIGADSLDTIKHTHGQYFRQGPSSRFLRTAAAG